MLTGSLKDGQEKPSAKNLASIAIFALFMAMVWTAYSYCFPYEMGHDQTVVGTMVAKDLDPGLYPRDYAFHDDSLYRNYIPTVRELFRTLTRLTGSFETGVLILVPVVVFVYALGMALLTFQLSGSLWAALLITFLSIPYRPAPPGEIWGVGGAEFLLARTLATAVAPYVFIAFFRLLEAPSLRKGLLTGILSGSLAFLHPPTGLFSMELFVVLFGLTCIKEPRRLLALGAMVLACGLVALYPLTIMERSVVAASAPVNFADLSQAVQAYLKIPTNWGSFPGEATERRVWLLLGATIFFGLNYLYRPAVRRPRALLQTWLWGGLLVLYLCWRSSGKGAGLSWLYALAAIYLVLRYRREGPERLDWGLLGLGFLTLAISLLPYYGLTLLWLKTEFLPLTSLVIEHYRAMRFSHLFIFLFSARVAVYLVRLLADWLKTSENAVKKEYTLVALSLWNAGLFWVVQGGVVLYEALRKFVPSRRSVLAGVLAISLAGLGGQLLAPSSLHRQLTELGKRGRYLKLPADSRADEDLYAWARRNTPKDALFYYGSALFRYKGQRSITHSQADLINHRDGARYVSFYRRYRKLEAAYLNPEVLANEARDLMANYLVLEKSRPVRLYFPIAFENQKFLVYQVPHVETASSLPSPQAPLDRRTK